MSNFLFYLAAFALVLGLLVLVHEYGHYLVARLVGVKVLRFSLGFGRPILSWRRGEDQTEWAIGAFPLGGYVKMLDEREGEVPLNELHRSFNRQSVGKRMAIVAAGPIANLLLAIVVYWGIFCYGVEEPKPILAKPAHSTPADIAGIEEGDLVLKVGDTSVLSWQQMRWELLQQAAGHDQIGLEISTPAKKVVSRTLDVSLLKESGWEGNMLEKLGISFYLPPIPPVVGKVLPDSVAERVGLMTDDEIVAVDQKKIQVWYDFVESVRNSPNKPLELEIIRNGKHYLVDITPEEIEIEGQIIGRIGAGVKEFVDSGRTDRIILVRYGPFEGLWKAVKETWDKATFNLVMIGKMIVGEVSWHNITGPVTIADYAGQSAKMGGISYLNFIAIISISLAVLNLLPVPILDGGHLLYYVAEIILRRPLSERSMEIGQQIGLFLLMLLMVCAFYNDINRLISG